MLFCVLLNIDFFSSHLKMSEHWEVAQQHKLKVVLYVDLILTNHPCFLLLFVHFFLVSDEPDYVNENGECT